MEGNERGLEAQILLQILRWNQFVGAGYRLWTIQNIALRGPRCHLCLLGYGTRSGRAQ